MIMDPVGKFRGEVCHWSPDTQLDVEGYKVIENHLIMSGWSVHPAHNMENELWEEIERPDKMGLTAEGFDDWDREKIDFATWPDNIKWYRGRYPMKYQEKIVKWIECIISVRWTDKEIV